MTELELLKKRVNDLEDQVFKIADILKSISDLLSDNKRDLTKQETNLHTIRLMLEKDERNGRLM
jgi:predicted  nucleic acid-binding Zn-ribbon protein